METSVIDIPHLSQHDWASLRMELIWIYDREVLPSNLLVHNDPNRGNKAWLIRQGNVRIATGTRKTLEAGPGQWIFLPRESTRHHFSNNARIFSIHFLCQWPSGDNLFQGKDGHVIASHDYPELENRGRTLERMIRQYQPDSFTDYARQFSDYGLFLRFQSLFLDWLGEWFRVQIGQGERIAGQKPGDNRALEAVRCLNDAPLDQPFPRAWLERETHLGEAHLNRLFLRYFGVTTRKYWERRKLEFAKACLESSTMPIKEIAYRLAFRSDSHFVIWFRRLTGLRPGEYRKRREPQPSG